MPDPNFDWPRFTFGNWLATLDSFVGVWERPLRSNCQRLGDEFGWNCVAWCAITQSVACNRLGFPLHTASVIEIERQAKAGMHGLRWSLRPVAGSLGCIDFKRNGDPSDMHVVGVYELVGAGIVGTAYRDIEGNYADHCDRYMRDEKFTRGFAVLPFAGTQTPPQPPAPPTPTPEEPDVKVHIYEAADGTSDGTIKQGAVYLVPEDLASFQAVPNEAWLRDAATALLVSGTPQVAPPAGTQSKYWADRGLVNVQRVSAEFLRPIVTG